MFFDSTLVEDSNFVWPDKTEIQFMVLKAEYGPNANGKCHILKLTVKDINGKAGQYFDRFVVKHIDKNKEKSGNQILKKFCNAVHKPKINNPQEFVGCKFTGILGIQEYEGQQQNYIKGYKPAKVQNLGQSNLGYTHPPQPTADRSDIQKGDPRYQNQPQQPPREQPGMSLGDQRYQYQPQPVNDHNAHGLISNGEGDWGPAPTFGGLEDLEKTPF